MEKFKLSDFFETPFKDGNFNTIGILDSKIEDSILTFIDNEKYLEKLSIKKNVTCLLITKDIHKHISNPNEYGIVFVDNPRNVFFKLHNLLSKNSMYVRKKFKTIVGDNCSISPLSYISKDNVKIGNNVIIEEFVSIKENVSIEDNTIIRAGTVIGGCGFEFKKDGNTQYQVEHLGGIKIGHDVEIQYNCAIDKAVFPWDNTIIGNYTKMDNLIHIGHAVKIGNNVMMPALSVIGGRVEIKDNAWVGIGSVVRNGLIIGENARINMGAVVTKDVNDNEAVTGNFAIEHTKFIKRLKRGEM